jgi:hypothetical protein
MRWSSLRVSAAAIAGTMAVVLSASVIINIADGVPQRNVGNVTEVLQYRKYNYWIDYRNDYCLLFGHEQTFSPVCVESEKMAAGATVLAIWGDSHGAHLYRGIKDNPASRHFAIAQFTSSSCPPVFDFDKAGVPLCRTINDSVRLKFAAIKPKVIILAHDWPQSVKENSLAKLAPTAEILRKMGVERIVLMGPVPHWVGSMPEALAAYLKEHGGSSFPARMRYGLDRSMEEIDHEMMDLAGKLDVEYISPIKELCNEEGCLTIVPGSNNIPMSWDAAHFTREGSRFFIGLIANKLFTGRPPKPSSVESLTPLMR